MVKLLKNPKTGEWLQVFISLVLITVQLWLDLKLSDYEKASRKRPGEFSFIYSIFIDIKSRLEVYLL